jgi:hypothetical protein
MLVLGFAVAQAQTVNVEIDQAKAAALGLDPDAMQSELEGVIADQLYTDDNGWYMEKYANASAMAIKGMGVDYASNPKTFVLGVSVGPAVSGVPFSLSRGPESLPEGGFALMIAAHGGVNLGVLDGGKDTALDHVLVYVSGMSISPPANREFKASLYNVGAHLQVSVGSPVKAGGVVEWGGIAFTGGYELSAYQLSLQQELPISKEVDAGNGVVSAPATLTWTANGTYDLGATASTIPLEVSTNLKIAVVTPFVGAGFDINAADATSNAGLTGPISAKAAGQTEDIGSASVTLAGTGSAEPFVPRLFGGVQLGLSLFKIYGQLNYGFNETYGAHVGLRLAK